MPYKNIHGQEQSPPEEPRKTGEDPFKSSRHPMAKYMGAHVEQAGLLALDVEHCQAPTRQERRSDIRLPCNRAPVCVMVENNPRPDGRIGALALCEHCRDALLRTHGPDYGNLTPL